MMEQCVVTVLMPTYDREEYIRRAVGCIVGQTFTNWKMLIGNDGGADVGGIVASFADPRIKYFNFPHRGKSATLNDLLKMVDTEYVAYMDDDDVLFPEHLETLYRAAVEHGSGFVFSDTYLTRVDKRSGRVLNECVENDRDVTPEMLAIQNFINHKQVMHRRVLAEKIGGYDEELPILIDFDFIRRLAAAEAPYHVRKITGRHYLYYDKDNVTSISGLWQRDPAACGRAILRIYSKTPADMSLMYHQGVCAINLEPKLREEIRKRDQEIRRRDANDFSDLSFMRRLALAYARHGMYHLLRESAKRALDVWTQFSRRPWLFTKCLAKKMLPGFLRRPLRAAYWKLRDKRFDVEAHFAAMRRQAEAAEPVTNGPRVSILCNAWNTPAEYLRQMLESVLLQSYRNWELLINNCSDDRHPEVDAIIREYAAKTRNTIRIRHAKNLGIALNTNEIARQATGGFVFLLDHDDILLPDTLAKLIAAQRQNDADMVYAEEYVLHMSYGRIHRQRKHPFSMRALEGGNFINHPVLIRKAVFDAVAGFRPGFEGAQDHELYFRIAEKTDRIAFVPEPLYIWRINENSLSERDLGACARSGKRAIEEHLKRILVSGKVIPVCGTTNFVIRGRF